MEIYRDNKGRFIKGCKMPLYIIEKMCINKKGIKNPNYKKREKRKCLNCNITFQCLPKEKKKYCSINCFNKNKIQENHPNWKGGLKPFYIRKNKKRKEQRHKLGISKKYISENGISYTKEYQTLQRHKRRCLFERGGELTIQTIQRIYEDNIKRYGTLTCYLCLQSIEFGQDSLEHKIPLSRGGTNAKENLAIAHRSCNSKKCTKTEEEYKMRGNKIYGKTSISR